MTTSQATCYFPDRSVASTYQVCNTTLAGPNGAGSTCCDGGSVCTTGGYCIGRQVYAYRGACTDKTWQSPNCASQCLNTNVDGPCNAVPCGPSGVFNDAFCCSAAANKSCCANTFVNVFDFPYSPESLAATNAQPQNVTSSSPKATTTSHRTPSSRPNSAAAVGAAVGVPLGVLLLLSLGFLLYREWKRRRDVERTGRNIRGIWGKEMLPGELGTFVMGHMQHEVGGERRATLELASRDVYEVGGG